MLRRTWVHVRTAVAIGGMAFAVVQLAVACLDYAGEDRARCEEDASADGGADCGTGASSSPPSTGSGSGSGAR